MKDLVSIGLAITTIALVATIVVNGPNSAKVVEAGGTAFSNSISAAEKG